MTQIATKRWSALVVACLLMSAMAFAGVSVSSPSPGTTTSSPVHFVASASGSSPISAMIIYLDSNIAYKGNGGALDTNVNMDTGQHAITVKAWDSRGNIYQNAFTLNVGTSGAPPPSAPSGAASFSLIEQMPGWQSCTTCAGAGGNGPSAAYSTVQFVGSPSQNGKSMQFSLGGSQRYSDALWWKQLGGQNGASHFQYDVDFYLTTPQYAQALEFDVNQTNGSRKFIFGTQCNIRDGGVWDVWDTAGGAWRNTGVACSVPAAYTWHHLTWELYRDSTATHFVAITLDGVKHYVNMSFNSRPQGGTELNVAFQMDGDYAQHHYSAWLNYVTLHYW
ncbi:MAG TPA: Ig-like domain-containing protein [Candidatus Angelobacter sp.]